MRLMLRRSGVLAALVAIVAGVVFAPAVFADTNPPGRARGQIVTFTDFTSFSAETHIRQTISFDNLITGALLGNPAPFNPVTFIHSSGSTFKTIGSPAYDPVSSPNVLAPFLPDDTLAAGETTLVIERHHRSVGVYLVLPNGSNSSAAWTTTVTATDSKGRTATTMVTFRGEVGEQQFIGFSSQHGLTAITFGRAAKPDATAVLAVDDVVLD